MGEEKHYRQRIVAFLLFLQSSASFPFQSSDIVKRIAFICILFFSSFFLSIISHRRGRLREGVVSIFMELEETEANLI